jgi:hypothetical protein
LRAGFVDSLWPAADELALPSSFRDWHCADDAFLLADFDLFGSAHEPTDEDFARLLLSEGGAAPPAPLVLTAVLEQAAAVVVVPATRAPPPPPAPKRPLSAPPRKRAAAQPCTPEKKREGKAAPVRAPAARCRASRLFRPTQHCTPTSRRLTPRAAPRPPPQKSERRYWTEEERAKFHAAMRTCVRAAHAHARSACARTHARALLARRQRRSSCADLRRPPRPRRHGTDFAEISKVVGTRTSTQVRTHVQKYHLKLVRRALAQPDGETL